MIANSIMSNYLKDYYLTADLCHRHWNVLSGHSYLLYLVFRSMVQLALNKVLFKVCKSFEFAVKQSIKVMICIWFFF